MGTPKDGIVLPASQSEPATCAGPNCAVSPGSAPVGPFEVYTDYDDELHIIDGNQRVMLSDSFAYDANHAERKKRMEWIAAALTDAWQAETTGDNMPLPNNPVRHEGAQPRSCL